MDIVSTFSVSVQNGEVILRFTPDARVGYHERSASEVRLPWSWPLVDSINQAIGVHEKDVTVCLATQRHGIVVTFWSDSL